MAPRRRACSPATPVPAREVPGRPSRWPGPRGRPSGWRPRWEAGANRAGVVSTSLSFLSVAVVGSPLNPVDGETAGVLPWIRRVERDAVEQRLGFAVRPAVRVTQLLHRFLVEVRSHHLLRDGGVVGR